MNRILKGLTGIAVLLLPAVALAQEGQIAGTVRDTSNALMPGVIEMARAIRASNNDKRFFDEVPNWARLHKIKNPVLITWGRDDRMTPLDMGLFPFRRLPNAEMHIFSNCGHWAQVERKSDFERLVIDFLTRD